MSTTTAAPVDLDALRAQITKQAGLVKSMKAEGKPSEEIQKQVAVLQQLRKQLDESATSDAGGDKWAVDRKALDECIARRMIVVPSFEIHGGVSGLFDYGPAGCALKENILSLWRQHFILEDNLLQIECTTLTPYPVLKASGHVDKFEDLMVKDTKTGECFRADKLLEDFIDNLMTKDKEMTSARREELRKVAAQAGAFKKDELHKHLQDLGVKSPTTGNDLTAPFEFNLMFQTSIGPTGDKVGFLRPETAQGMFVNFKRLYDYNYTRLPMGVAQIGSAYRNEIAPRGGLLRVREFTMAEIEFFVNPDNKDHAKFDNVKDLRLTLFPGENQIGDGKTINPTVGEAVAAGIINNQTLAYFMGRTAQFLVRIGIKPEGLRFRQHLRTEMAHYACDCWDAEIMMSSGWIECVGIADRSAYDLKVHAKATKTEMWAREVYPEPREEEIVIIKLNSPLLGRTFKGDNAAVLESLNAFVEDQAGAVAFQEKLTADGSATLTIGDKTFTITKDMVSYTVEKKRVTERKFVPNVIEPSFGIGRIITGVLEHNFSVREGDDQRAVLSFQPIVAPFKTIILPLDSRLPRAACQKIATALTAAGYSSVVDDSGASIGKRYSRVDEIGVPFCITYDHESLKDNSVTIRERDTCAQIRVPIEDVVPLIRSLVEESQTFSHYMTIYTVVTTGEDKASAAGATHVAAEATAAKQPAVEAKVGGTAALKLEGTDRHYGRFYRPA